MRSCRRPAPCLLLATLALLLAVPAAVQAAWIDLGGDRPVSVELISDAPGRTVYAIEIGGFEATPVTIAGQTYHEIILGDESRSLEPGLPALPDVRRAVRIPHDRAVRIEVLASEFVEIADMPVAPSKGNLLRSQDPATVPHEFAPFYRTADTWPAELVTTDAPHVVRDLRGTVVDANVFQYRPASQTLRVCTRLVVAVVDDGPARVNPLVRTRPLDRIDGQFADLYADHFLNVTGGRYEAVSEDGGLLIIADDALASAMQPLVEWKLQRGLDTRLQTLSETGYSFSQIRSAIATAYADWAPAYVLLVGDIAQIPIGSDSDPEYACLVGSDSYPELFVGRFSAENPDQVATQVLRTITYERDTPADVAWMQHGMGIASNQGPGDDGEYDDEHEDVIRQKLLDYGYLSVDRIYDPSGTAGMVTSGLNAGRGIINYTGHGSTTSWGSTGFSNTHVNALTNHDMLPFISSVACNNGTFTGTCFAETWLRATDGGTPTGAIAAYMSYISQSWNPPMCGQDHAVDLLVEDRMRTIGGLWFNGSCQMMDEYGSAGENEFLNWTIFGDPSLMVRTMAPLPLAVDHDGVLLIGMTEYVVQTGEPGARCALYGDGVVYGTAIADAGGQAVIALPMPPTEPMVLTLTVTAYNRVTAQQDVQVLPPEGPYLVHDGVAIDDDQGDQDGQIDAGETVGLTLSLENVGVELATGVTATLASDDPLVTVTSPTVAFDDIPAGAVGTSLEAFAVAVDPAGADGHLLEFTVAVAGDGGAWDAAFSLPLQAPALALDACLVDDAAGGDGSGTADAGESVEIALRLHNTGAGDAAGITATLASLDANVHIRGGSGSADDIPAGGMGLLGTFSVEIMPTCPEPALIVFTATVDASTGPPAEIVFELPVGGWFDDMEADRGWTAGAAGDDATTGVWLRADPVGTEYSGATVQPEDDHTVAPGTDCWVTGNGPVGGAAGEADVDGGRTTLLSPVFDLSGAISAELSYWRWYSNDAGNNPGSDWWEVSVTSDGTTWVQLEYTQDSAASWQQRTFELSEHVTLTEQVQIRFVASDEGGGSLVEAAVDDVLLDAFYGSTTPVDDGADLPAALALTGNHPNPFNPATTIGFAVPRTGEVELAVFDLAGRRVATLVDGVVTAGHHQVTWQGRSDQGGAVASGVYFCRLADGQSLQTRKMLLVK
ncbi:T9SS type A sorting domain-containing protein [bacterium]|nr:T9SS type A sorting domain-containing protein [bacterium]